MERNPTPRSDDALLNELILALVDDLGGLLHHVRIADDRLRPIDGFSLPAPVATSGPFDQVAGALEQAKAASGELVEHLENAYTAATKLVS